MFDTIHAHIRRLKEALLEEGGFRILNLDVERHENITG